MAKFRQLSNTVPDRADYLLHSENLTRMTLTGGRIKGWLRARTKQMVEMTAGLPDPDISIVIRTRNDDKHIRRLFDDIQAQMFNGAIEIIVVDTESRDDTIPYARSQGATIIPLKQRDFTYPKALNVGFQAARHPWILTLVGHSSLSNRLFLKSLTYWCSREENLGGLYSLPLANWNASTWERLESVIAPTIWKEPSVVEKKSIGIMGANSSFVKRDAWERLGGYDEHYAGGGEDRAFALSMLEHDISIVREPLCSVFHSHGLGMKNSVKQWLYWGKVGSSALPFETEKIHKRRPDLR